MWRLVWLNSLFVMWHEFSVGARVTPYVYHSVVRKHLRDTQEGSGSNIKAKYMSIQYLNNRPTICQEKVFINWSKQDI